MGSLTGSLLGGGRLSLAWSDVSGRLVQAAVFVVVAWLVYRIVVFLTRRLERAVDGGAGSVLSGREQRGRTIAQLVRNVAGIALLLFIVLSILNLFVPIGPLLAGTTIFGLAFSFGAQTLVRDLISGFFILMEGQYAIGDVIRINQETAGQVERMTLRVVVLRDVQGVVHIIPNGEIRQVSNLTKEWSRAVLEIGVAYREDVDHVMEVLREIGRELWEDEEWNPLLVEEPVVPGVEKFADSAVLIRFMAKTVPLKQWDVARELRRRIKGRFDEEGIEIPYPHLTFYWGEGQRPDSPPPAGAASEEPA